MEETWSEIECTRNWLLSGTLNFARYTYRAETDRQFIVARHHRLICEALDRVLAGETRHLIINIAPRYGKTELAVRRFIAMGLAVNPRSKFIHLSYSGNLAKASSIAIKDTVKSETFRRHFEARIKYGSDTMCEWDTEQGGGLYATSTLGQITGFGAGEIRGAGEPYRFSGAIIIDDPIKPEDALSDVVRERVNRRFETTIRSRVNSPDTPIIIIMQRLHENDLCGYLMATEPEKWEVLSIPCLTRNAEGEEEALWPLKHTVKDLHHLEEVNTFVYETQFMQNPKPLEGLMYQALRTYQTLPMERGTRKNYTDTADTGADYLCSICYLETKTAMYITDVLYTDNPMEYTEPETARMLLRNDTQRVRIESNNGGRGFSRNVERNVRETGSQGGRRMSFTWFFQGANKQSRIFTRSAEVQNLIFFPEGWELRWPQFANAVKSYRKEGNNLHDDAPDALTGMCEDFRKAPRQLSDEEQEAMESILY